MREWWQWSPLQGSEQLGFAIIGVGRFGIAVCRELLKSGAEVLAVDRSERAIDELRQLEPSIEARVVDCTEEDALREAGVLDMGTVVVAISADRSQHHRHADRERQRRKPGEAGDRTGHKRSARKNAQTGRR